MNPKNFQVRTPHVKVILRQNEKMQSELDSSYVMT